MKKSPCMLLRAVNFTPAQSREKIYAWIIELSSPETREAALLELSKKREVEIRMTKILNNQSINNDKKKLMCLLSEGRSLTPVTKTFC